MNKQAFIDGYTKEAEDGAADAAVIAGAGIPAAGYLAYKGAPHAWELLKAIGGNPGARKLLAFLGLTAAGAGAGGMLSGIAQEQAARDARGAKSSKAKKLNPFA